MALGDYILCCKCEVKLIYDGDRGQREWWEERFGKNPEIECPDCKPQRKPLTDEEIINKCLESGFERNRLGWSFTYGKLDYHLLKLARAIEAAHDIKE